MTSFMQSVLIFIETKGTKLVVAAFALIFGVLIIKNLMKLITKSVMDSKLERSMIKLLLTLVQFLLYFVLLVYILSKLGIGITGIIAALSALTLGLGLAVQDVVGSLANGIVLVTTRPFKVGDYVDIGGVIGTIKETNLMHTVVDTKDNVHIYLPNNTVYNSQINNFSANQIRRYDVLFRVDYDTDLRETIDLLNDFLNDYPNVLKNPEPGAKISEAGDSALTIKLTVWTETKHIKEVADTLLIDSLLFCKEHGIKFPFPQVTLSQREPLVAKLEETKC